MATTLVAFCEEHVSTKSAAAGDSRGGGGGGGWLQASTVWSLDESGDKRPAGGGGGGGGDDGAGDARGYLNRTSSTILSFRRGLIIKFITSLSYLKSRNG